MKKLLDRDFLGVLASIICLIHCLCLPWLLMISGAWLSSYLSTPWFHHLMLAVAMLIGLPVFISSYFRYKSKLVLILGSFGLALTSYGTLQEDPCCPPPAKITEVQTITYSTLPVSTELSQCEITCASEGSTCGTDAPTELNTTLNEQNHTQTENDSTSESTFLSAGLKSVPLGVAFILLAHILNFRHRRTCKKHCCDETP